MYKEKFPLYTRRKLARWFPDDSIFDRTYIVILPKFLQSLNRKPYVAITLGHTICFLMPERYRPYKTRGIAILAHELKHVEQYEEVGLIKFWIRYFLDWRKYGYRDIPVEKEAFDLLYEVFDTLTKEERRWK